MLVPGSGGKDSVYAAHVLKYKYGMNPLTVTWAPHIYTEVGWRNFQSWLHAGFDNYLFTPNGRVHRTLTRLAFENLLHPVPAVHLRAEEPRAQAARRSTTSRSCSTARTRRSTATRSRRQPRRSATPRYYAQQRRLDDLYLGGVRVPELAAHGVTAKDLDPYLPADPACSPRRRSRCTTSATT